MKTMIAIPCMDTVPVQFMQSMLYLDKAGDVSVAIESGSLIYDSRNDLLKRAMDNDIDRIFWVDSDMQFEPDTLVRLSADIDKGCDIVTGICYKRRPPFEPTIFKECYLAEYDDGHKAPVATFYTDYPEDGLFEVEACGFACLMMSVEAVRKMCEMFGPFPFSPALGFGEDLSFCIRAKKAGLKIWADPSVQVGHVGYAVFDKAHYERYREG